MRRFVICDLSNIIRAIRSRRMKGAGHDLTFMREINSLSFLFEKKLNGEVFRNLGVD
jgi:hypothetical protein